MSEKKRFHLFGGLGGGQVTIELNRVIAAYDINDTQKGSYCCVLLDTGSALNVLSNADQVYKLLKLELRVLGGDDGNKLDA